MDISAARRFRSAALAVTTIMVGLAVHRVDIGLNTTARDVAGDALWAAMIFYWLGALMPAARSRTRLALAIALCATVEMSQLYHHAKLDALRAARLGHLILGSGFEARDFMSYVFGAATAALLERAGIPHGRATPLDA